MGYDYNESELNEQKKVLEGNISLALDSYDAIFSDFDPRPYSERLISDDFLIECRRAVHNRKGVEQLRLLIPSHMRKPNDEIHIKKRLKEYFRKHLIESKRDITSIRKAGFLWFFLGSILLVISTLLYEYKIAVQGAFNFVFDFLFIISQPAGWFICWEGLDKIFVSANPKLEDYKFFKKMENAEVYFLNY
ncbi:hypothetical protein J4218_05650 [Candidatus Pacearchaeota archaeon]|nr:hypothetical protein [Candidatus Pacearchaeota archaeon]